jgi:uncharacterized protein YoxC
MSLNGAHKEELCADVRVQENRLSRVEEDIKDLSVCLGKLQTHQEHMAEDLEKSGKAILKKLEEIDLKTSNFEIRLAPIEKTGQAIKSVVKSIVLALSGALATGLGSYIWSLFGK